MNPKEEIKKLLVEYDYPDCLYRVLSILNEWESVDGAWYGEVYVGYAFGNRLDASTAHTLRIGLSNREGRPKIEVKDGDDIIILKRKDGQI